MKPISSAHHLWKTNLFIFDQPPSGSSLMWSTLSSKDEVFVNYYF